MKLYFVLCGFEVSFDFFDDLRHPNPEIDFSESLCRFFLPVSLAFMLASDEHGWKEQFPLNGHAKQQSNYKEVTEEKGIANVDANMHAFRIFAKCTCSAAFTSTKGTLPNEFVFLLNKNNKKLFKGITLRPI